MVDVHDPATRSRNMAAIGSRNTRAELQVRRFLHRTGFRYLLHDKRLIGRPDLVFPKHRAVILVHGCFFHGHGCRTFRWPATNAEWWRQKIQKNRMRDTSVIAGLRERGWRVLVVWECAVREGNHLRRNRRLTEIAHWIRSRTDIAELAPRQ
jgi:DNA mismatch endonuclease (patch repair protein)